MRYVVLGASAAGINGVRELRRLDPESEIILVSRDREIYSRCILHHYLGGKGCAAPDWTQRRGR